jgi:hypothetical protein
MASIYDKSSLVLIPSGTKTGKIFSQKPVSGDGDFTFTRASAATRVNADGNIEKETSNLLLQSNFSSSWSAPVATMTGGQSGYDGSSDAWLLSATGNFARIEQTNSSSGVVTLSVYAKAGTADWIMLRLTGSGFNDQQYFDLANGSVGINRGCIAADIEDVGGGWYRCSATTSGPTLQYAIMYIALADGNLSPTNENIYIQDAQLEQGLVARDYQETTTAAVYGGITDNTPRLDYTDSSCPALLLEPQRTNYVRSSEFYDVSSNYSLSAATIVEDNFTTSPEGLQNASKVTLGGGTSNYLYTALSGVSLGNATLSCWAKADSEITIGMNDGNQNPNAINLTTEWQRFEFTFNYTGGGLGFQLDNYFGVSPSGQEKVFYLWGLQAEQGSYATSYIPTYGSSVSRVADGSLSLPTSQTLNDFTLYWEGNLLQDGQNMLFGGGTGGWYLDVTASTGRIVLDTNSGRKYQALSTLRANQKHKVLMKRANGVVDAFVDGVKLSPSTQVTDTTALSLVSIAWGFSSTYYPKMKLNEVLTIQSALTDQEAIDLTTI